MEETVVRDKTTGQHRKRRRTEIQVVGRRNGPEQHPATEIVDAVQDGVANETVRLRGVHARPDPEAAAVPVGQLRERQPGVDVVDSEDVVRRVVSAR